MTNQKEEADWDARRRGEYQLQPLPVHTGHPLFERCSDL